MRGAVVNWFAKVAVSYDFANETVVAALSHFDRLVCRRPLPLENLVGHAGHWRVLTGKNTMKQIFSSLVFAAGCEPAASA